MTIYGFNMNYKYTSTYVAKENPVRAGSYLIPAYRTDVAPPVTSEDEFAVFYTNIEHIGDSSIDGIECGWKVFNSKTSILDDGVWRVMTEEEKNASKVITTSQKYNSLGISEAIQNATSFVSGYHYASSTNEKPYKAISSCTGPLKHPRAEVFEYTSYEENLRYMVFLSKVIEDVYTISETVLYNEEEFSELFFSNPTLIKEDYGSGEAYVFMERTEYAILSGKYFTLDRVNGSISVTENSVLRELGVLPPSSEQIYEQSAPFQWYIETTKLNARKEELAEELYNYRISVQEYYKVEVNGIVFRQRWTEYDHSRMLAQINMNDDDYMLAWRFSGVDLTQTTMISISQLRDIYKQGEYNETCCSLAQYLVYYKLLGLTDTTDFDLKTEFDKDLVFVKENYETVVVSLKETFTEIINSKNNSNTSTDTSSSEETTTSETTETTEEVKTEESVSETSSSEETTETTEEDTNGSTL